VCLVESGGLSVKTTLPLSNVAEQLGVLVDPVQFERHAFGGASNQWGGLRGRWFRVKPLDPIDFEARPWVDNSGWPFSLEELRPFLERAANIFKVASLRNFNVETHHNHLVHEFHNSELDTTIFQMIRPLRFGKEYRRLLARSSNIRAYIHGKVIEIEEDPNASVIRYFKVATHSGKTCRISAKQFVLACGGLETPRLLLVSRRKMACGIGNAHDLVGRYYMQHPKGLHGIAVLNQKSLRAPLYTRGYLDTDVKICAGISFSEEFQRREGELNHCIMLRPILSLSESHASQAYRAMQRAWQGADHNSGGYRELQDFARFMASVLKRGIKGTGVHTMFSVLNHMEQIPKQESRLDLSERKDRFGVNELRIDWRIDSLEKASLCRLHELVQARVAAQCGGRLESHLDPLADDWPVAQDSAHHLGTTRMHADPRRGVVDPHCRVHSVRNLFIAGNSIFPTSGHANPTLTVVALAIRLADHLKGLFKTNDGMLRATGIVTRATGVRRLTCCEADPS
jgi:choline dehydrogenase-like flavoprotein